MGIAQTVLRSRALAALTSPPGVDRYLEIVNPMWAAKEMSEQLSIGTIVLIYDEQSFVSAKDWIQ